MLDGRVAVWLEKTGIKHSLFQVELKLKLKMKMKMSSVKVSFRYVFLKIVLIPLKKRWIVVTKDLGITFFLQPLSEFKFLRCPGNQDTVGRSV